MTETSDRPSGAPNRPAAPAVARDAGAAVLPERVRRVRARLARDGAEPAAAPQGWQNWYSYWS